MAHTAPPRVTVGVDTHKDLHVAAARDQLGRRLATTTTGATSAGYAELLGWALGLGEVTAWGVEGTGSYGAGLTALLHTHGERVVEVSDRVSLERVYIGWPTPEYFNKDDAALDIAARILADGLSSRIRCGKRASIAALRSRRASYSASEISG